jgi:hypothetical protein
MDKKIGPVELAVGFLDAAKNEYDDPSYASALALIGIGNALLQIEPEVVGHAEDLHTLDARFLEHIAKGKPFDLERNEKID